MRFVAASAALPYATQIQMLQFTCRTQTNTNVTQPYIPLLTFFHWGSRNSVLEVGGVGEGGSTPFVFLFLNSLHWKHKPDQGVWLQTIACCIQLRLNSY